MATAGTAAAAPYSTPLRSAVLCCSSLLLQVVRRAGGAEKRKEVEVADA
jgi:hypothetical protein